MVPQIRNRSGIGPYVIRLAYDKNNKSQPYTYIYKRRLTLNVFLSLPSYISCRLQCRPRWLSIED
jgi:hypothetical protein